VPVLAFCWRVYQNGLPAVEAHGSSRNAPRPALPNRSDVRPALVRACRGGVILALALVVWADVASSQLADVSPDSANVTDAPAVEPTPDGKVFSY